MKKLYVTSGDIENKQGRKKVAIKRQKLKGNEQIKSPKKSTESIRVNLLNSIVEWYKGLKIIWKIVIPSAVLLLFVGISGVVFYLNLIKEGSREPLQIANSHVAAASVNRYYTVNSDTFMVPSLPRDITNPINGELLTKEEFDKIKKFPPVAVMVENHTAARPHSGLDKADVIYEAHAEGGITRFMAIFWSKSAKEIGPVRSARQYFVEMMSPYDAYYMHIGGAQRTGNSKTNAIENIYAYGIKTLNTGGTFWRSSERYAPHNAYSSTEMLQNRGASIYGKEYDQTSAWKFKPDALPVKRGASTTANVRFIGGLANGGAYDTKWVYEKKTNLYKRFNGGVAHTDLVTGQQYTAKNVVIMHMDMYFAQTGKGHVVYKTEDNNNKVTILMDGKVITGTWKKENRTSRERFLDSKGKEIQLNRGQTWVIMYPYEWGSLDVET